CSQTRQVSATLKKLLAQAVVFLIWTERNSRLHNGAPAPTSVLFSKLDRMLRDTLLARLPNKRCQGLLSQWFSFS
ncbi:unnamed protein product, partial [Brassica oleracea]